MVGLASATSLQTKLKQQRWLQLLETAESLRFLSGNPRFTTRTSQIHLHSMKLVRWILILEYTRKTKVVTADEITRIKKEIMSGSVANPNVGVISAQELQRIRQEAVIHTAAEKIAQQKILAEQMQQQQAKATAKKKYMQDLASEAQSLLGPELSDLQQEDLQKQSALRKNAEQVANENRDEVKYMNQLVETDLPRSHTQKSRW